MPLPEIRRGYFALNITLPYGISGCSQALMGNIRSVWGIRERIETKKLRVTDKCRLRVTQILTISTKYQISGDIKLIRMRYLASRSKNEVFMWGKLKEGVTYKYNIGVD